MNKTSSPTRHYVAFCNKSDWSGYYFIPFHIPSIDDLTGRHLENNSDVASWFYLNRLDSVACINGTIPFESFSDVRKIPGF